MKVYIKNKMISLGGSSKVLDINGNPAFMVKGRVFSLNKVKKVCDTNGNLLFKVRNKFFNFIMHSAYVYDANGNRILKVKDKAFSPDYYITSEDGAQWSIQGKWFSFTSQIVRNGQVVAVIRRKLDLFRDSFELETSPENMPLMIALVIAVDNIVDRRSNQSV